MNWYKKAILKTSQNNTEEFFNKFKQKIVENIKNKYDAEKSEEIIKSMNDLDYKDLYNEIYNKDKSVVSPLDPDSLLGKVDQWFLSQFGRSGFLSKINSHFFNGKDIGLEWYGNIHQSR